MAGKRTWTDEQSLAINTRDRTLLISAAAGAGKTATLTERIIRSLLDEEKPENINEMLIVTFTKAAVAELRERIGKALKDAVLANPDNPRLRAQLALLPGAKIQTIWLNFSISLQILMLTILLMEFLCSFHCQSISVRRR